MRVTIISPQTGALGEHARPVADDYANMNRDELIKLIVYLRERLEGFTLWKRGMRRRNLARNK